MGGDGSLIYPFQYCSYMLPVEYYERALDANMHASLLSNCFVTASLFFLPRLINASVSYASFRQE